MSCVGCPASHLWKSLGVKKRSARIQLFLNFSAKKHFGGNSKMESESPSRVRYGHVLPGDQLLRPGERRAVKVGLS